MTGVLFRQWEREFGHSDTEAGESCEDGPRDCNYTVTEYPSQRMLEAAKHWERQGGSSPRGCSPTDTLIWTSSLQKCERKMSTVLGHPVFSVL